MRNKELQKEEIDFVLLWVDGEDPEWQKQKNKYIQRNMVDGRPQRYRDFGLLKYWFRGVELFAPWVRKIHFVTWGHLPDWLDTSHPKLNIVKHSDYLPEEYLPTFSSHPLELNLHRIKGISERFVYFNDDVFLINNTNPRDFFIDGKPVDMLALQPIIVNPMNPTIAHIHVNNSLLISRHFKKRTQMKQFKNKFFYPGNLKHCGYNLFETAFPFFSGFYIIHGPSPIIKDTIKTVWSEEYEVLDEVSKHKFRSCDDVSQYIFREWQMMSGNFVPTDLLKKFCYITIGNNLEKAEKIIRNQKRKMICLNDTDEEIDYEAVKSALSNALESIMPESSSFEKQK